MSIDEITNDCDIAVIGAGVFGSSIAYQLQRTGRKVMLLDAYGPANSRASSSGETRVIRCSYGDAEIFSRWAWRSLTLWQEFFARIGQPLFHRTGVLWLAREHDSSSISSLHILQKLDIPHESLSPENLKKRYPQMSFGDATWAIYEPNGGALMARRAVQELVTETRRLGGCYMQEAVIAPKGAGELDRIVTQSGKVISAKAFVFACGPWLPKIFPAVLEGRIHSTRQEVFFFGVPPSDNRFSPPYLPVWADLASGVYGLPDIENRGFKIALDCHGPEFDPDAGQRITTAQSLATVRKYMAEHFPALAQAPVIETRVCQYENTCNGDFLIDRHPDFENVWLVGGGSGHGFKHGPAVGEYVATRLYGEDQSSEPRFSLATKSKVRKRVIY